MGRLAIAVPLATALMPLLAPLHPHWAGNRIGPSPRYLTNMTEE